MAAGNMARYAIKYGVKYGPHVIVAAKALKEPATAYAQKKLSAAQAKRAALAQAATLQDGTVLKVFYQDSEVWVVFSGDTPITAHPDPAVPMPTLLQRADLTRRMRPEDLPSTRDRITAASEKTAGTARAALRRKRPEQSAGPQDAVR